MLAPCRCDGTLTTLRQSAIAFGARRGFTTRKVCNKCGGAKSRTGKDV